MCVANMFAEFDGANDRNLVLRTQGLQSCKCRTGWKLAHVQSSNWFHGVQFLKGPLILPTLVSIRSCHYMWPWHLFQQGAFGNRFKDSKSGRVGRANMTFIKRIKQGRKWPECCCLHGISAYLSVDLRKQIGLSCCEATLLSMRLLAYLSARNLNP